MSTNGSGIRHVIPPTFQADAVISQANPVSGTKYTVLPSTANVRLRSLSIKADWTVQPTPLESHITFDGIETTYAGANPATGDYFSPTTDQDSGAGAPTSQVMVNQWTDRYIDIMPVESKSMSITGEITGGTVQLLYCRVKYLRW